MKPLFKLTLHPVVSAVSTVSAALLFLLITAAASNLSGAPALHVKAHKKQNPGSVIFANRLPPLVLAAEPIALPTGLDPSLVIPKQITESGNFALFIHREFVEKRADRPLTETTPVSPVVGWRLRTAPSRAWQELRRPTEGYDYITGIDGGIIGYNYHYAACASVEKINERGQVAGLLPTNVGNILYSEHPSSEVFPHPVLWPWSVSQPQRLPVGNLTLTGRSESVPSRGHRKFYPARLGNVNLDPSGRVWLGFTETRSDQFAFGGGYRIVRGGTLQTGPLPTSPMIYLDHHLRAISPDGRMQAWHAGDNSHFAAQGWGDYIPPPAGPVASAFAPATLPMAGTVLSNDGRYPAPEAGWGQISLTTPPALDPDRRLKVLAFNSKGDVLAQAPAASHGANAPLPELWSWRGLPTGSGQPLDGSYQQRRLTFVAPPGWRVVSIVPSLTRDYTLLGTIQQQSDFVGTTRRPAIFKPVSFGLEVDANRDGQIAPGETSTATAPFRFWSNDDDDDGDLAKEDIPGQISSPDYEHDSSYQASIGNCGTVDGRSDLIDFFPVFLNIKELVRVLPPNTQNVIYKLKQAKSAVNFVYTNLTRAQAFDYLKSVDGLPGYGYPVTGESYARHALTIQVTAAGTPVVDRFLTRILNEPEKGVILIEGRQRTDQPLRLVVEKEGAEIAEVSLPLKISPVEDMYRRLNLRDRNGQPPAGLLGRASRRDQDAGLPTYMGEADESGPKGYPDTLTNGKWFVMVVGSNVGGAKMRGWQSEVFKRMYWSKSKARFVGVSWFGDPYSDGNDLVYDYHCAARNAFATAPALAAALNGLSGSKTVAGHSAAALIISSAVADHGLNATNICLLNAAMARECYDGAGVDNTTAMVPAPWQNYPPELWSSRWHERFAGTADARAKLTWRDRFANALNNSAVHNFYSSTEDVLGRFDGTVNESIAENLRAPGAFAWVIQEKAKGDKLDILGLDRVKAGSNYGGWGFNLNDPITSNLPKWYVPDTYNGFRQPKSAAAVGPTTTQMLIDIKIQPLFRTGWGAYFAANPAQELVDTSSEYYTGPSWIFELYGKNTGSALAADPVKRTQLLNEAIPALSLALGANRSERLPLARNHNMPDVFADSGWPRPTDEATGLPRWHHSDMREVAYLYMRGFYDELSSIANQ